MCSSDLSQCLYAGSSIMNYTPDFGWYYIDANHKAPAWTGVQYLYQFLTREVQSVGPAAVETRLEDMEPGDLVQLSFDGQRFSHTPVVVVADHPRRLSEILVAAHSYDHDYWPLTNYEFTGIRFLHITGVNKPSFSQS